jgi:hypothetical protein
MYHIKYISFFVFMEQRANLKFCFRLGKTTAENRRCFLAVYGKETLSRTHALEWFKGF